MCDICVLTSSCLFYYRQSGNGNKLKFEHLEELMHDFEQSLHEDQKFSAERLLKALDTTGTVILQGFFRSLFLNWILFLHFLKLMGLILVHKISY